MAQPLPTSGFPFLKSLILAATALSALGTSAGAAASEVGAGCDTTFVSDCCAACDGCSGCRSCCDDGCGFWFAHVDALILTRNNASIDQPIVLADDTGATVLSSRSLNFDWNAGPRAFVGRMNSGGGWELGYFGINGSTATARAEDPNNLDIPPPLSSVANDFDNADAMALSWDWTINNAEFNLLRDFGGVQLLCGFRYFNLEEGFNIRAEDADGDVSNYRLSTSNNLFGAQIGGRAYQEWNWLGLGITGKAGVFGNDAIERQILRDNDDTIVLRDAHGRASTTAFVGDIDLFATVRINDSWRLRGGYYLLWVSDVALAPDQLDFSFNAVSGTQVVDRGSVFFHGATAGLEASW